MMDSVVDFKVFMNTYKIRDIIMRLDDLFLFQNMVNWIFLLANLLIISTKVDMCQNHPASDI